MSFALIEGFQEQRANDIGPRAALPGVSFALALSFRIQALEQLSGDAYVQDLFSVAHATRLLRASARVNRLARSGRPVGAWIGHAWGLAPATVLPQTFAARPSLQAKRRTVA